METFECIKTRRSIRNFQDKDVPQKFIDQIIDAIRYSPSSLDCQPWEIIVVKSKQTIEKIAALKDEDNRKTVLGAPALIVICIDKIKSPSRAVEDGNIATGIAMLAAHALGLGSVYVTGFSSSDPKVEIGLKNILALPQHIRPIAIIPLGYASKPAKERTLRGVKEITHLEKW